MRWKQSSDQIIYDLMQATHIRDCAHFKMIIFSSQGYENEICSVRKERDQAVNSRITELKDKSIQVDINNFDLDINQNKCHNVQMFEVNEEEDFKVALDNKNRQLETLK